MTSSNTYARLEVPTCTTVLHSRQLDLGERDDPLASAEWLQGDGNNLANTPKKDVDEATGSPEGS